MALGVESAEVPIVNLVCSQDVAMQIPPIRGRGVEGACKYCQRGDAAVDGLAAEVLLFEDPAAKRDEGMSGRADRM